MLEKHHVVPCHCRICVYVEKFKKAVEENDKKFLMEHLDQYLNICEELDWLKEEGYDE